MHLRSVLLCFTCLLAPTVAHAKRKVARSASPNAYYVVIAGGGSVDAAQAAMKKLAAANLSFVKLTAGFPQQVVSETVAGLNPGFHIVVLGYCREKAAASALAWAMQEVAPGTYIRKVTGDFGGRCPSLLRDTWVVKDAVKKCEDGSSVSSSSVDVKRGGASVGYKDFEGDCKEQQGFTSREVTFGKCSMLLVADHHRTLQTSEDDDAKEVEVAVATYELWRLEPGGLVKVLDLPMADEPSFGDGDDCDHLSVIQSDWAGMRSFEYTWNPAKGQYDDTTPPDQAKENAELDSEGD